MTFTRISDPENAEALEAFCARLRNDPSYAKSFLQRAGILTSEGKLAEEFGGEQATEVTGQT